MKGRQVEGSESKIGIRNVRSPRNFARVAPLCPGLPAFKSRLAPGNKIFDAARRRSRAPRPRELAHGSQVLSQDDVSLNNLTNSKAGSTQIEISLF